MKRYFAIFVSCFILGASVAGNVRATEQDIELDKSSSSFIGEFQAAKLDNNISDKCNNDTYEPDDDSGNATAILSSETQSHSICPVGDEDWLTFTIPAGPPAGIVLETSGSLGDTRMWLYDSNLIEIEYNDDGGTALFSKIERLCDTDDELPPGTYYVKIDEYNDDGTIDNYDISLAVDVCGCSDVYEPNDNSYTATTISSGDIQTHSICPVGEEDWLTFTIPTGSPATVVLETSGVSGNDTRMWLYDSNLTQIEYNDDGGTELYSRIDRLCETDELPPGTYYVKIDEYYDDDIIENYDISLIVISCDEPPCEDSYEPDGDSGNAATISFDETQTHSICPVGDEDWLTFTIPAGPPSAVVLETSGVSGNDTRMWLYDSNLTEIEYNDDSGTELYSRIDRLCETDELPPGTYYVKIDEYGDDEIIESYDISLTLVEQCIPPCEDSYEPNDDAGNATAISSDVPQTHSICPIGDEDWLTFTIPAGPSARIILETSGVSGNDTRMWLYDSNLTEIEYNDDGGTELYSKIDRLCETDELSPGTYYVKIDEYYSNEIIESYDILLIVDDCECGDIYEPNGDSSNATTISSGDIQAHSICPVGDEDWLTFTIPAGPPATVVLETSGVSGNDTRMWLYDSNLTEIEYNDDGGTELYSRIDRLCETDELPSGTYYVKIDEYGDDGIIDSYNISLTVTTCTTCDVPLQPSRLRAITRGRRKIRIRWRDNSNNELGFKLERKRRGCGSSRPWTTIADLPANSTSYRNTGLRRNRKYSYRVRAYNDCGYSTYSNCRSATTNP